MVMMASVKFALGERDVQVRTSFDNLLDEVVQLRRKSAELTVAAEATKNEIERLQASKVGDADSKVQIREHQSGAAESGAKGREMVYQDAGESDKQVIAVWDRTAARSKTIMHGDLANAHSVENFLAEIKDVQGGKEQKRAWLKEKMEQVNSITSLNALHKYYSIAGDEDLFGGPYADQNEGQAARATIEWGLHKYNGVDWSHYMNKDKATKAPDGEQVGVGSSANLIAQVYPPHEKFVVLVLAWLPVDKYPWVGPGGVGVAHTHGQATCNFKFLNVVEGAGNTFYDIGGSKANFTEMFLDGQPHHGGCKNHGYKPILLNPEMGRQFVPSKDLVGSKSGFIQDDYGAHSIDNLNTEEIAYSIHVYYPPYPEAWAFHEDPVFDSSLEDGQECAKRHPNSTSNCKHPRHRKCGVTSMKAYLERAREYKSNFAQNDILVDETLEPNNLDVDKGS